MKARDIMSTYIYWVRPEDTMSHAVRTMLDARISGLPVIDDDGALVGMVSESDFLRRAEIRTMRERPRWLELLVAPGRLAEQYVATHARRVEDIMTRDVVTVTPHTGLDKIVELMEQHNIKRIPVVRNGRVVGIVSRADVMRSLARVTDAQVFSSTDAAMRHAILAELKRQTWRRGARINPLVHDGVVDLWGTIGDERERAAVRVIAENTAGVKQVYDHIVSFDGAFISPDFPEEPAGHTRPSQSLTGRRSHRRQSAK